MYFLLSVLTNTCILNFASATILFQVFGSVSSWLYCTVMVAMEMICDSHICGCGLAESLVSYVNGTLHSLPLPLAQVSLQKVTGDRE